MADSWVNPAGGRRRPYVVGAHPAARPCLRQTKVFAEPSEEPLTAQPTASRGEAHADWESFDAFYGAEYPQVCRLSYALCGRWEVAEELTQEAFVRAFQRWDGQVRDPSAWVRTVVVNLCRSRFRRLAVEFRALARIAGSSQVRETEALSCASVDFLRGVRSLPRRQRQAVVLYYIDDRSVLETAHVMGCAEGTVKALLHRARSRLADFYPTEDART